MFPPLNGNGLHCDGRNPGHGTTGPEGAQGHHAAQAILSYIAAPEAVPPPGRMESIGVREHGLVE